MCKYPSEYPYVFGLIDWCLTSKKQYSWEEQLTSNKSCKLNDGMSLLVDVGNAAKLWKGCVVDKVGLFCIATRSP
jgi:hypothetical protein